MIHGILSFLLETMQIVWAGDAKYLRSSFSDRNPVGSNCSVHSAVVQFLPTSMAFLHRIVALVAIGSAAAFSPLMSSAPSRRTAIQGAGAAAVMSPLLRPAEANADSIALPGNI